MLSISSLAALISTTFALAQPAKEQTDRERILNRMQLVMGELPDRSTAVPLDLRIAGEVRTPGYVRKKITYQAEAGDRVPAYLLVPVNRKPGQRLPAILCLHQTTNIGKGEPAGLGGKPNLRYAQELAERGYVTLAPDYPSFGDYQYDFAVSKHASGSIKAIWNNIRAVDLLQSLPEVDGKNIGCIGHSLGGHNSLFTAAFEPRIRAVATSCGFTSFPKYYGGKLKGWSSARYMPRIESTYELKPERMPFDFTDVLSAIAPRAVFVVAPLRDDNFEVSGVRDVARAIDPVFRKAGAKTMPIFHYPDCAHDFPPAERTAVYEWFDKVLELGPRQSGAAGIHRWQLRVTESAGIRRFGYPVQTRIPLPADLPMSTRFRLLDGGTPVPATFRRSAPDRSNQTHLQVDFAVQQAPLQTREFILESGLAGPEPHGGLRVEQRGQAIVVRHGDQLEFAVPKNLAGFLSSVRNGTLSYIAPDSPGLWLQTRDGKRLRLGGPDVKPPEIIPGPLCTQLRFTGANAADGASRWEVSLSFVASKSWVECEFRVIDDPTITAIGLNLNLVQHQAPALVDLGAGSLVYAALKPGQEIRLLGGRAEPTGSWRVDWRNGSAWEPFVLPGKADKLQRAEGWAHVMDDLACTALAIADFDGSEAPAELKIDAKSRIELSRRVAKGTKSLRFWLHFVNMPVHVGAVTSPQAMLAPLELQIETLLQP